MTDRYGIQYYDAEAHDYLWYGGCHHRTGLPERTWPSESAAQAVIDAGRYPPRRTALVRSDYAVVAVPEEHD